MYIISSIVLLVNRFWNKLQKYFGASGEIRTPITWFRRPGTAPSAEANSGTLGGTRTRRTYDLNVVCMPFHHQGIFRYLRDVWGTTAVPAGLSPCTNNYVAMLPPGFNWYGWRDSNPQNSDFKSDTYTKFRHIRNHVNNSCTILPSFLSA